MSTFPSITSFKLGPLSVTSKGSKHFQISKDDGPLVWQPSESFEVPFEPSHFSDKESSRVNICFVPTEEIENCLELLESWCIKALTKESKELLGQELTESQIKERFQSSLKTSEEIIPVQNEHSGQECSHMLDTKQSEALASRILAGLQDHAKTSFQRSVCDGLYVMGRDVGMLIDVTHVEVEELVHQCPFDESCVPKSDECTHVSCKCH